MSNKCGQYLLMSRPRGPLCSKVSLGVSVEKREIHLLDIFHNHYECKVRWINGGRSRVVMLVRG